jgi:transcriptional regulator with XRE-family HTH domain
MPQSTAGRFKQQRLERGMSLRALAAKCKQEGAPVSDSQLSKIERGLYAPRPRLRAVLAEVLDMDVTELGS